ASLPPPTMRQTALFGFVVAIARTWPIPPERAPHVRRRPVAVGAIRDVGVHKERLALHRRPAVFLRRVPTVGAWRVVYPVHVVYRSHQSLQSFWCHFFSSVREASTALSRSCSCVA